MARLGSIEQIATSAEGGHQPQNPCSRITIRSAFTVNLMENACKWTEAQVNVSVRRNGAWVIAVVSDVGPGLPAQRLREVRERGVRPDETVPGSGLGLAIDADLAALYGGRVDLSSPGPDVGLATELYLPAAQALAAA